MDYMSELHPNQKVFVPKLPKSDNCTLDSVLAFAPPKSGSVLLQQILSLLATQVGLAPYSLAGQAWQEGFSLENSKVNPKDVFFPKGYAYGVFRQNPYSFEIPIMNTHRSVVLVRDPRDMLVSHYFSVTKSHPKPKGGGEVQEQLESDRLKASLRTIDEHCITTSEWYGRVFEQMSPLFENPMAKVFRYEDVIFQKRRWVREIAAHFDWPHLDGTALNRIADKHDVRPINEDASKHVRSVVPGDHRQKLKPQTIHLLDQKFESFMNRFEYY